ncbi:hypothetical protein TSMEX_000550 [Taenia solium]|eukprot:TsM_000153100 transcript=TsM_000153100 gene=TsM_000153100
MSGVSALLSDRLSDIVALLVRGPCAIAVATLKAVCSDFYVLLRPLEPGVNNPSLPITTQEGRATIREQETANQTGGCNHVCKRSDTSCPAASADSIQSKGVYSFAFASAFHFRPPPPPAQREKWLRGTSHSASGLEVAATANVSRLDSSTFGAINTAASSSSSSEVVVARAAMADGSEGMNDRVVVCPPLLNIERSVACGPTFPNIRCHRPLRHRRVHPCHPPLSSVPPGKKAQRGPMGHKSCRTRWRWNKGRGGGLSTTFDHRPQCRLQNIFCQNSSPSPWSSPPRITFTNSRRLGNSLEVFSQGTRPFTMSIATAAAVAFALDVTQPPPSLILDCGGMHPLPSFVLVPTSKGE